MELTKTNLATAALTTALFIAVLISQLTPTFHIIYDITLPKVVSSKGEQTGEVFAVSIWKGVQSLWERHARLLAVMLGLWSGALPLMKVILLFVNFERCNRVMCKLGTLAFLDIYAIYVIVLAVRIPEIRGCKSIFGFQVCSDVGMLFATPQFGIFMFVACIATTNYIFQRRLAKLSDTSEQLKSSHLLLVKNVLYLVVFMISLFLPLLSVRITSMTSLAKLQPELTTYTLPQAFALLMMGTTPGLATKLPSGGSVVLLTAFCFITTLLVPIVQHICVLLQNLPSVNTRCSQVLGEWNHLSVFLFAVLLVAWQIEELSQEFSIPSSVLADLSLLSKELASGTAKITINLHSGYALLCIAAVIDTIRIPQWTFGLTIATDEETMELMEGNKKTISKA